MQSTMKSFNLKKFNIAIYIILLLFITVMTSCSRKDTKLIEGQWKVKSGPYSKAIFLFSGDSLSVKFADGRITSGKYSFIKNKTLQFYPEEAIKDSYSFYRLTHKNPPLFSPTGPKIFKKGGYVDLNPFMSILGKRGSGPSTDIQDVEGAPLFLEIIDVSKGDEKIVLKGPVFEYSIRDSSHLEMMLHFWNLNDDGRAILKPIETMVLIKQESGVVEKDKLNTDLMLAAEKGDLSAVKNAIADDADINTTIKYDVTPLFIAAQNGHVDVVKLLLEAKADVNVVNKTNGATPLFIASVQGYSEIAKLLLEAGADVNTKDTVDGVTPLFVAANNGHNEIVKLLLETKAGVNIAQATTGCTALWQAAWKGHTEIVKALLEAKADVNVVNKTNGVTPLFTASANGHTEVVKLLLSVSADANVKVYTDGKDYTSLSIAKERGYTEIVMLLTEYGAKE